MSESDGYGGSPYSILIDLAKIGATFPLEAAGLVGEDQDAPTSYTDVMTVRDTGRRTFYHCRGANALLDESDFDFTVS